MAIFVHLVSLTTLVVLVAASVGARPRVKPRTTDQLYCNKMKMLINKEEICIKGLKLEILLLLLSSSD